MKLTGPISTSFKSYLIFFFCFKVLFSRFEDYHCLNPELRLRQKVFDKSVGPYEKDEYKTEEGSRSKLEI